MDYESARGNDGESEATSLQGLTQQAVTEVAAAAATRSGAVLLVPNAENVVVLPAGASLDDIEVRGRDLVIEMPDGRVFVIADGAVFVPVIVIDGVAVPPLNLAAYLIGEQPEPAAGGVQSSGGNFADPAGPIQPAFGLGDLLPYTELNFPLVQTEEVLPGLINHAPAITFVPRTGDGTEVNEAGLPPSTPTRSNESQGSSFDGDAVTTSGVISFTSLDGVGSVTLNGVAINPGGASQTVLSDGTGTLVVTGFTFDPVTGAGTILYTYTLNDNTAAGNGTQVSVPIVVTDRDGDAASDTLVIRIIDDAPTAFPNTDTVDEGGTATGNVLTEQTADIFGADGPAATTPAGGVIGVRAAGGDTASAVTSGTGSQIEGLFGTLVLNANGTYTYVAKANITNQDVQDVFVYTIEDGDGDRSTTTLTITIDDVSGTVGDNDVLVDESGLDGIGSQIVPNGEFFTGGQISVSGASGVFTYTLTSPADGTYGTLVLNAATGAYSYTLDTPFDGPTTNNGRNTISGAESFGYQITDQNGNVIGTGSIDVSIVDDVPTAFPNTDTVDEGGTATGNVLTEQVADIFGADGPAAPAGGVIGVRAAGGDTASEVAGGTGSQIQGLFGTLVLNANGSYTYVAGNTVPPQGAVDVFVYTIEDGDGDRATTTLTITLADVSVSVSDNDVLVDESGLDGIGSQIVPNGEFFTGGQISASGPSGPFTYTLTSPADGTYGTLVLNSTTGAYSYTLDTPFDGPTTNNGRNTIGGAESFGYQVTDQNGNVVGTGSIDVSIVDDVPTAFANSNTVDEGGVVSGNVLIDQTADIFGADGPEVTNPAGGVVGVRAANGNTSSPVLSGVGTEIAGAFGTLTLNADGTYSYQAGEVFQNAQDVFVYTIRDGDGDLSTTTLVITINDTFTPPVLVPPTGGDSVSLDLFEAGLDTATTGDNDSNDIAPGSVTGSDPAATTETDVEVAALTFTAGTDPFTSITFAGTQNPTVSGLQPDYSIQWTQDGAVLVGTLFFDADGAGGNPPTAVGEAIRLALSGNTGPFVSGGTTNVTVKATLTGPLEHLYPNAVQGPVTINGIRVVTAEGDGEVATGLVNLTVHDDVPSLAIDDTPNSVTEGEMVSGTWSLVAGADGVTTVEVTVPGEDPQTLALDGTSEVTFNTAQGVLVISADFTWEFTAQTGLTQPLSQSFTISAVDGDNDPTADTHEIAIQDGDSPSVTGRAALDVHEAALDQVKDAADIAAGSVDGTTPAATTETDEHLNALSFVAGSDAFTSIGFAAAADQNPTVSGLEENYSIQWTLSGGVLIGSLYFDSDGAGGPNAPVLLGEAIQLELSGNSGPFVAGGTTDVSVKATLTGPLEHDYPNATQGPVTISGLKVVSAEADGEVATGLITVTVHDDVPTIEATASAVTVVVDESDLAQSAGTIVITGYTQGTDPHVGNGTQPTLIAATSLGSLVTPTAVYGADGAAASDALVYSFALGADTTPAVTTTAGTAITLVQVSDTVVVGYVTGGTIAAFALEIDPTSGAVKVEQYLSLQQLTPGGPGPAHDEPISLTGADLLVQVTVKDGDGDTAALATPVNIGSQIAFEDDGPSVTATASAVKAVVDESSLAQAAGTIVITGYTQGTDPHVGNGTQPTLIAGTSPGSLVTPTADFGVDGAAASGSLVYKFVLGAETTPSVTTTDGTAITLAQVSDTVVVGYVTGGTIAAFALEIDPATGAVKVEQYLSLQQLTPGGPGLAHDEPVSLAGAALLVQVTVKDGDGDTAALGSPVNIGSQIEFEDDGPNADNDLNSVGEGAGHSTQGNVFGAGGAVAPSAGDDADSSGVDGPASDGPVTGARTGTIGAGGSLAVIDADGENIAGTYGTLNIRSDGSYTYTLTAVSVPVNASETFTYQIKDGDGDTDLAQLAIAIDQDQNIPLITGDAKSVDEKGLPAGTGELADAIPQNDNSEIVGGSFKIDPNGETYSLTLTADNASTLVDPQVNDLLTTTKGVLKITSVSAPDVNGVITYGYEYTLSGTLDHVGQGKINPISDVIQIDATDATGDNALQATVTISILDDLPDLVSANDRSIPNGIGTYTEDTHFLYGADGAGSVTLQPLTTITGLTYSSTSAASITASANGNPYFTISIDQTTGEYSVEVLSTRPVVADPIEISSLSSGNFTTISVSGTTFDGIGFASGAAIQDFTNDGSTINVSGNGFGVDSNLVRNLDGFIFSSADSETLTFSLDFQPNTSNVRVTYATYDGGLPSSGAAPTSTGFVDVTETGALTPVVIDPTVQFDHIVIRFDYIGPGQPQQPGARVQDFIVGRSIIPDDQVISFGVTVTDGDGDTESSSSPATQIDLTFLGGAPVPPVVLDLDGDGLEFAPLLAGVAYDYDGDGKAESTAWAGKDDGLLVHDANGDGLVTDASEFVFGNASVTDLQALAARYGDALDAEDADFASFGVWRDANGDGVSQPGEVTSLAALGIVAIGLQSDGQGYSAANGDVTVHGQARYVRADGSTGLVADASFATDNERIAARGLEIASTAVAAGVMADMLATQPLVADPNAAPLGGPVSTAQDAPAPSMGLFLADAANAAVAPDAGAHDDSLVRTSSPLPDSSAGESADGADTMGLAPVVDHSPVDAGAGSQPAADDAEGGPVPLAMTDFGSGDVMDGLLLLAAAPQGASAQPSPGDMGAVHEALADAHAEGFVDALVAQLGSDAPADHTAPTSDLAGLLAANVGSETLFLASAFDFNQAADEAHALASAA